MTAPIAAPPAPMQSAAMKYRPDGQVDWARMWDSF